MSVSRRMAVTYGDSLPKGRASCAQGVTLAALLWVAVDVQAGAIRWRGAPEAAGTPQVVQADRAALRGQLDQAAASLAGGAAKDGGAHVVVQFTQPIDLATRARLAASGVTLQRYLGSDAYFALVTAKAFQPAALANEADLLSVQPVQTAWKLHPLLTGGQIPAYTLVPGRRTQPPDKLAEAQAAPAMAVAAYVLFYPDVALNPDAVNVCLRYGAVVRSQLASVNGLVIELPQEQIIGLAGEDTVQWIEPALPRMEGVNDGARWLVGAEVVQNAAGPYGLDGSGVGVLVYDAGTANGTHMDFGGRVHVRDASGFSSHSQHVAGTVGGSGLASQGKYRGMAPGVTIESYGFEFDDSGVFLYTNPGDIEADYRQAMTTYGTVIASNSIGSNVSINGFPCDLLGDYGVTSSVIDGIVTGSLGLPMRIVWANGNERSSNRCTTGYRSIAPPSASKNPILVGAVNSNDDSMTSFSSWGPTDDGRLRPDVCAPGCQVGGDRGITSTSGLTGYAALCGTSMATPVVTGLCSLLIEQWHRQYGANSLPLNSTLKALLVQTAQDLGTFGPDYQSGYGSVRIQAAVDLLKQGSVYEGEINQGETQTFIIDMPEDIADFKITLAWDDPPGTPNVVPQLVNDLDLTVIAPSPEEDEPSVLHYPWTLAPNNPALAAVNTQPDRLNNVEQVWVRNADWGAWVVRVRGHAVTQGPQRYSLAAIVPLQHCSVSGTVAWSAETYACGVRARLTVSDCDLNADSAVAETVTIPVRVGNQPAQEVALTETGVNTGMFAADLTLSDQPGQGDLLVQHGDAIVATYVDAKNADDESATLETTAKMDCQAPAITDVAVSALTALRAVLTVKTSEPALVRVRFGASCQQLDRTAFSTGLAASHDVTLPDLRPGLTYFYVVEAEDTAGNLTRSDNAGACFTLSTPDAPDYYARHYLRNAQDLAYHSLLLTPDGSIDFYSPCLSSITELPVDPAGGQWVKNNTEVTVPGGRTAKLYGTNYASFWINTDGTITFTSWDFADTANITNHFTLPRISGLFNWFYPSEDGRISWKALSDRIVVTWQEVRDAATARISNFQIEMFDDGRLRLSWLEVGARTPVVGLSKGTGVPSDYVESDVLAYAGCAGPALRIEPTGPLASRGLYGQPLLPASRTYTLTRTDAGQDPLDWQADAACGWVSVVPPTGSLAAGQSATVEVRLNNQADQLPPSPTEYACQVTFHYGSPPQQQVRDVQLAIIDGSPPKAIDRLATTAINTAVDVQLLATDDGLPAPPGALVYQIVTPPQHGTLQSDDGDNHLQYVPAPGFVGADRFTYLANDGGTAPTGGNSNTATVMVRVLPLPAMPAEPQPADGSERVRVTLDSLSCPSDDPVLRRVAIVAASYPDGANGPYFTDTRDLMVASGLFESVAIIDAAKVTLTLAELQAFDAIITWSNDQYQDPKRFGDVLADYVDAGGGVVVAIFANVTVRSYATMLGRFLTGDYFCIDYPGGGSKAGLMDRPRQLMDRVFEPQHPIMAGVRYFDGGIRSFRIRSSYVGPGGKFLAMWSDGAPLVAAREINGTPRADLAMFPPSNAANIEFWIRGTDGDRLISNAVAYTARNSRAATTYDILLDTQNPPQRVLCSDALYSWCPLPEQLAYGTTYYWQIKARNFAGVTVGPVWSFSTTPSAAVSIQDTQGDPNDGLIDFGGLAQGETATHGLTICNTDANNPLSLRWLGCVPWDLFADSFDEGDPLQWEPLDARWWHLVNGELEAATTVQGTQMQAYYRGSQWQDMSVGVNLRRVGSSNTFAGLALRAGSNFKWNGGVGSAYIIGISATGQFYVGKQINGAFSFIKEWGSNARLKSLLATNQIVVNLLGPRIEVYLNGYLAWAGEDSSISGSGYVGLLGYSDGSGSQKTVHLYDDVWVRRPMPPVAASLVQQVQSVAAAGLIAGGTALVAPEEPETPNPGVSTPGTTATAADVLLPDPCVDFLLGSGGMLPPELLPGECATIKVPFAAPSPGFYEAAIAVVTNDAIHPYRRVHLMGMSGPSSLEIAPADPLEFAGPQGGPWSPGCGAYVLRNNGTLAISWSLSTNVNWLVFSDNHGQLSPGQSQEVTVCLTPAATTLPPGELTAQVSFMDQTIGLTQTRLLKLNICRIPPVASSPVPADRAVDLPVSTELAWNVGLPIPQSCGRIGSAAIGYRSQNLLLGTTLTVDQPQMLHGFKVQLNITGSAELHFIVMASSKLDGSVIPMIGQKITVQGTGTAFYSSGPMYIPLSPGTYYSMGVGWNKPMVGFGLDYQPYPIKWSGGMVWGRTFAFFTDQGSMWLPGFTGSAAVPVELCLNPAGQVLYDVLLGPAGQPGELVCGDVVSPNCRMESPLDPGTRYQWQVVARNSCGATPGPVWTFTTLSCANGPPQIAVGGDLYPRLRRVHGSAGAFEQDLTRGPANAAAVECRLGSSSLLFVPFSRPLQAIGGLGVNTVHMTVDGMPYTQMQGLSLIGQEIVVQLGDLPAGAYEVGFPGLADAQDASCAVVDELCFLVLGGDVNSDRQVNIFDLVRVRNSLNTMPGLTNFREDVNADGMIDVFDLVAIRERLGGQGSQACP